MKTLERIIEQAKQISEEINKVDLLTESTLIKNEMKIIDYHGQLKGLYFASGVSIQEWHMFLTS